jgi:hypothetical protein
MPYSKNGHLAKYGASDLRGVLHAYMPYDRSGSSEDPLFKENLTTNVNYPLYSSPSPSSDYVVFSPASDLSKGGSVASVEARLKAYAIDIGWKHQLQAPKILIPVAEENKILGFLMKRMHWVTVEIDVTNAKAHIIDTRPWYVSMFYSTGKLESMIQKGMDAVYRSNPRKMTIDKTYTGVQHEDITCGPRVSDLIARKAGVETDHELVDTHELVNHQIQKVMSHNKNRETINPVTEKPGLLARARDWFTDTFFTKKTELLQQSFPVSPEGSISTTLSKLGGPGPEAGKVLEDDAEVAQVKVEEEKAKAKAQTPIPVEAVTFDDDDEEEHYDQARLGVRHNG